MLYATQLQMVSTLQPYCKQLLVLREHIDERVRIVCTVVLELNENVDVELEQHDCSDVALVQSDCIDVVLGQSSVVLEQSSVALEQSSVALERVDCIQDRLVSSVCSDELLELHGVQLVQPCNEQLALQLLCSVRLSHECRIFEHESVELKQFYRSGKLCQHCYVPHFRECVDRLVHGDGLVRRRQLEHTK